MFIIRTLCLTTLLFLTACAGIPEGIEPVNNFNKERYLGKWYEVARLDHSFEEDLVAVSATYSSRDNGSIKVVNRGYSAKEKEWKETEGTAKFAKDDSIGYLKVSFFGPFYGSYVVADLNDDYTVSMVTGPDRDYLWFLARSPTLPESEINRLVAKAKSLGFETDKLIFVDQERNQK